MQYLIKYASDQVRRLAEGKHTKNIGFSAVGAVANPALQLLATPYLFKHLGAVEFGIWALINSLLSAASVASFGLGESATKFVAKALAEGDSALAVRVARGVLTIYGALGIITPLFVALAAPWIAVHFFDLRGDGFSQGVMWVQIACAGLFFRFIYGVFESVARGYHRYDTEAMYGMVSTLATTVAALLCVFVGLGLTAILICSVGVLFVSTVGLAAACARLASSWRVVFPTLNLSVMKPLMPFSLFAWLQSVNGFGLHTCDRFIVGYFLGPAAVGFYSACLQLVQTLHFVLARAFGFLFPAVVKAHTEGNQTEMLGLFRKSLLATTAFGIAGSGFVICFSYDILRVWMGTEFAVHSSATLTILALWNLILSTTVPQFYFLNAAGQERVNTAFGFLSSAIAVGTSLILVPIIGERGAALGRLASSITGVFSRQVTLRRLFARQVSSMAGYATMAVPLLSGVLFCLAVWAIAHGTWHLTLRGVAYAFACVASIYLANTIYAKFLSVETTIDNGKSSYDRPPRILISGCVYGAGNIGDEAILHGLNRLFPPDYELGVVSRAPDINLERKTVKRFSEDDRSLVDALEWADTVFLGGGTLLADSLGVEYPIGYCAKTLRMSKALGKDASFLCVGASKVSSLDAVSTARRYYNIARTFYVRNSATKRAICEVLEVNPDKVIVTCDPGYMLHDVVDLEKGLLLLQSLSIPRKHKRLVAVSVVNEGFEEGRHYHEKIAAACDELVRNHECRIVFVYAEIRQGDKYDQAAARKVQGLMREEWTEVPPEFYSPELFAAMLGHMDAIIAMRMHVVILAALSGKSCVTIVREPKVAQILSELGIKECGTIDDITAERIVANVAGSIADGNSEANALRERTRALAARGKSVFLAHWEGAQRSPDSVMQSMRVWTVKGFLFAKAAYTLCKRPFRPVKIYGGQFISRGGSEEKTSCRATS